jgi:hemerythrin-like domain-containing protein
MMKNLLTPAPDFSEPLELLHACHGRIEQQCATLLRLPEHLAQFGSDAQAQQAAERVSRYFSSAGQYHHEDEEQDLFPLLRQAAINSDEQHILSLLDNLVAQHGDMFEAWQTLQPYLAEISRGGAVTPEALPVARFVELYRRHIALEEADMLPYARQALSPLQLQTLGKNMAARRGVKSAS